MNNKINVIEHPLVQHKLTLMRKKETSSSDFRRLANEISMLLAYEVTRDMPLSMIESETPLAKMLAPILDGKKVVLVSVLRAGNGILDGMLEILPSARVGHIGLYREPNTMVTVEYYMKLPEKVEDRDMIVVDPLIATGNSAIAAVQRLRAAKPRSIKFVSLLASRQGIDNFHHEHPDVDIYTAGIDEGLNEDAFIIPGLGDAGDRIFGTK